MMNTVVNPNSSQKPPHSNLQSKIITRRGYLEEIRDLEKTRVKIRRKEADLGFLKQCRDANLTPAFAYIKHRLHSQKYHKVFERFSKTLIRLEIRKARSALARLSSAAFKTHLKLATTIDQDLWKVIDASAALKANKIKESAEAKHVNKLVKLQQRERNDNEQEGRASVTRCPRSSNAEFHGVWVNKRLDNSNNKHAVSGHCVSGQNSGVMNTQGSRWHNNTNTASGQRGTVTQRNPQGTRCRELTRSNIKKEHRGPHHYADPAVLHADLSVVQRQEETWSTKKQQVAAITSDVTTPPRTVDQHTAKVNKVISTPAHNDSTKGIIPCNSREEANTSEGAGISRSAHHSNSEEAYTTEAADISRSAHRRSCNYVDFLAQRHEVDLKDIERAPMDPLSPFFGALIEGINRSESRRRGLMLFCFVYLNVRARDALILSVDRKGFDVLVKVSTDLKKDASSSSHFEWKDFSFSFGREVEDIETFCCLLAKMEEEALKKISGSVI